MLMKKEFFEAVFNGDIALISTAIIDDRFDINEQTEATKRTALHIAISNCNIELIKFLISNNADCNIADKYKILPLRTAVACSDDKDNKEKFENYIEIITILLRKAVEDKSENWRDKTAAINVLANKRNLSEEAICLLMELLEDSNWHVKTAVIKTLSLQEDISKKLIVSIVHLIIKAQKDESCKESWHIRLAANNALDTLKKKYPEIEDLQTVSSHSQKSALKPEEVKNEPPQSKSFFSNIFGLFGSQTQMKEEEKPLIRGVKLKKE